MQEFKASELILTVALLESTFHNTQGVLETT